MAEEDCPCLHNDAAYRPGDSIRVDCNTWWVHALRGGAGGGRGGREQQLKDHMDRGPSGPWAGPLAGGREELRPALPLPGKAPRVPSLPGRCPRPGSAQQMAGLQVPGLQKLLPATPADGQGWVPILVPTVAVSRTYLCPLQHLPEPQVGVQQPALPGHLRGLRGRPLHHLRRRAVQLRGQLRVHAGPGMGSPRPSAAPRRLPGSGPDPPVSPVPGLLRRQRHQRDLPHRHREHPLRDHRGRLLQGHQALPGGEGRPGTRSLPLQPMAHPVGSPALGAPARLLHCVLALPHKRPRPLKTRGSSPHGSEAGTPTSLCVRATPFRGLRGGSRAPLPASQDLWPHPSCLCLWHHVASLWVLLLSYGDTPNPGHLEIL